MVNEGFASYLETVQVEGDRVWFGHRTADNLREVASGRIVPLAKLVTADRTSFHGNTESAHYSTAWAFVHFLFHGEKNRHRPRFDRLGALLSQRPDDAATVISEVFPELTLSELEDRLREYVASLANKRSSPRMGMAFTRPSIPTPEVLPADPEYIERIRTELRKLRRPDKL